MKTSTRCARCESAQNENMRRVQTLFLLKDDGIPR